MAKAKEYREFATAAKEIGYDTDERMLAAIDPSLLLEGTSDELKRYLTPEMLISFFKSLTEADSDTNRDVLEIAKFLYDYRADVASRKREVAPMNEKDCRLVNLGCRLIENAFYAGKLYNLEPEQGAVTAFITNVLAKIIEQKAGDKRFNGFSATKLEQFVEKVRKYEEKELFPDAQDEVKESKYEQAIQKVSKEIADQLEKIENFEQQINWDETFSDLAASLRQARTMLIRDNNLIDLSFIDEIMHDFNSRGRNTKKMYGEIAREVQNIETRGLPITSLKARLEDSFAIQFAMFSTRNLEPGSERSKYFDNLRTLERIYKRLKLQTSSPVHKPEKKDKRTSKGFGVLEKVLEKSLLEGSLPGLRALFEPNPEGSLGAYAQALRKITELQRRRFTIGQYDRNFTMSVGRLKQRMNQPASPAYLIKTCLTADNMMRNWRDSGSGSHAEWNMATRQSPFNFSEAFPQPSHHFLNSPNEHYNESHLRKNQWARLHFIPEDLPFAVWALKYLRSKSGK